MATLNCYIKPRSHEVISIVCRGPDWLPVDPQEGAPWTTWCHPHPVPHRHTPSSRRQDEILLSDVSCGVKMTQGPQTPSSTPASRGQASCGCQMCKGRKLAPGLSKHLCSLVIGYIFQELDTTHAKSHSPQPSRLPDSLLSQPQRFWGVLRRQHGPRAK